MNLINIYFINKNNRYISVYMKYLRSFKEKFKGNKQINSDKSRLIYNLIFKSKIHLKIFKILISGKMAFNIFLDILTFLLNSSSVVFPVFS